MQKAILLSSVNPEMFGLETILEVNEALEEFACELMPITDFSGKTQYFISAKQSPIHLALLLKNLDMSGTIVEINTDKIFEF